MDLNEIHYFTRVAQLQSFSGASRETGIPKSSLSRKISQLESRLGVTLLQRTTRKVKLTEAGLHYFHTCQKALLELEGAEQMVSQAHAVPAGRLRIAAPIEMGSKFLSAISTEFLRKYPEVQLEFILSDKVEDLVEEKIDLAVRAGKLDDSSLMAVKLGYSEFQLYASPEYLKKFGEPKTPKELEHHQCLVYPNIAPQNIWELNSQAGNAKVTLRKKVLANQLAMITGLALAGCGIALIPVFMEVEEIQRRQLVRVLPQWSLDREPIHAVYVKQTYFPNKTRLFLDILKKAFARS